MNDELEGKSLREKFLEDTCLFFSSGTIKELYYTDSFSILEVAEKWYYLSIYNKYKQDMTYQQIAMIDQEAVKSILKYTQNNYAGMLYAVLSRNPRTIMILSPDKIDFLNQQKHSVEISGGSKFINNKLNEKLLEMTDERKLNPNDPPKMVHRST